MVHTTCYLCGATATNRCRNPSVQHFSLHKLPADKTERNKWLKSLRLEEIDVLNRRYKICSGHFLYNDYNNMDSERKMLKSGSVPSQNLTKMCFPPKPKRETNHNFFRNIVRGKQIAEENPRQNGLLLNSKVHIIKRKNVETWSISGAKQLKIVEINYGKSTKDTSNTSTFSMVKEVETLHRQNCSEKNPNRKTIKPRKIGNWSISKVKLSDLRTKPKAGRILHRIKEADAHKTRLVCRLRRQLKEMRKRVDFLTYLLEHLKKTKQIS